MVIRKSCPTFTSEGSVASPSLTLLINSFCAASLTQGVQNSHQAHKSKLFPCVLFYNNEFDQSSKGVMCCFLLFFYLLVTSLAKEVMFLVALVSLSLCLSVDNITQKVMNGLG